MGMLHIISSLFYHNHAQDGAECLLVQLQLQQHTIWSMRLPLAALVCTETTLQLHEDRYVRQSWYCYGRSMACAYSWAATISQERQHQSFNGHVVVYISARQSTLYAARCSVIIRYHGLHLVGQNTSYPTSVHLPLYITVQHKSFSVLCFFILQSTSPLH